jgi:hypothetical protein
VKETIIAIAIALAAAAAAHAEGISLDGWQLVPIASTVRIEPTRVDMVWEWTDPSGEQSEQRIAVDGCAEGKGRLYLVEDDYSLTVDEIFDWTRDSRLGDIALTMCQAARQA